MKKLLFVSLILILCYSLSAASSIALLSIAKGKVDVSRAAKAIRFKAGDLLQHNDEIRTGGESFAAYKYVDGSSTVKVFSNSLVKVLANSSGKSLVKQVSITKGSVFSQVKPKSGTFMVKTPTTVASVKGTGFLTKITEAKQSMFIVTEGEVQLKILDDTDPKVVSKGNTAIVEADGRYIIRLSTPEDLSELERAELESTSERGNNTMRIPMLDPSGRTRFIEITY